MNQANSSTTPPRILVPLDGSPQSVRGLEIASRLPASSIELLRVVADDFTGIPGTSPSPDESEYQTLNAELEALAAPLREAGTQVLAAVRFGDAATEIIEAARDNDLIVMTTRGMGAAGRMLFGSVADRVSRNADTPTLLVRSQAGAPVESPRRVIVPLDGSSRAEAALELATRLANTIPAPLSLTRVVDLDAVRATISAARKAGRDGPDIGETWDDARAYAELQAKEYLDSLATPLRERGVDVDIDVLGGTPAFALLWNTNADDLVVMTSHGHGGFRRWYLGSVAEKLVRECEAPLLLVPARNEAAE